MTMSTPSSSPNSPRSSIFSSILSSPYTTPQGLDNIHRFQNKCVNHSISRKFFLTNLFRTSFQLIVPAYIHPHVLSLCSFVCLIIPYLLNHFFIPDFTATESTPRWVYLFNAIFSFAYLWFDNISTLQARKLSCHGPLNHFFDRTIGTVAVVLLTFSSISCLNLGANFSSLFILLTTTYVFFMRILEHHITGTIDLERINGPNEGVLIVVLINFVTTIASPSLWDYSFIGLSFSSFLTILLVVGAIKNIRTTFSNLNQAISSGATSLEPFHVFVQPAFPMYISMVFLMMWYLILPSVLFETRGKLLFQIYGLVFVYHTWKLILCILSMEGYKWFEPRYLSQLGWFGIGIMSTLLLSSNEPPEPSVGPVQPQETYNDIFLSITLFMLYLYQIGLSIHFIIHVVKDIAFELGEFVFHFNLLTDDPNTTTDHPLF